MNHIKLFEEHNINLAKDYFKDKINWKLFRYLQNILIPAEDLDFQVDIAVLCNGYLIYEYSNDENVVEGYNKTLDKYWIKTINNLDVNYAIGINIPIGKINDINCNYKRQELMNKVKDSIEIKYSIEYTSNLEYYIEFKLNIK